MYGGGGGMTPSSVPLYGGGGGMTPSSVPLYGGGGGMTPSSVPLYGGDGMTPSWLVSNCAVINRLQVFLVLSSDVVVEKETSETS